MNDMPLGPLYDLNETYLERPSLQNVIMLHTQYELRWAYVK